MYHKITGYLLIVVGLLFIFFAVISLSKVFIGGNPVVQLVQFSNLAVQTQYGLMQIPIKEITPIINLSLFSVFMLCVMTAGGHLAKIGTNLLKTERIHDALLRLAHEKNVSSDVLKKL